MWILFGFAAILAAVLNVTFAKKKEINKWFGFSSLSLTALTMAAFYSDAANRVINEDWGGLMDILPTMSKALWVCVIASILINGSALLIKENK